MRHMQRQIILRNPVGIGKTIFGVQRTGNRATMKAKILGRNQYQVIDLHANCEMSSILKLVIYITAQIWRMPAHAQRLERAQHTAWIELPGGIGIIQNDVWGTLVVRNHARCSVLWRILL